MVDSLDSGDTLSTSGIVLLSVGGALLIGGVIYLAVPDSEEPSAKASVSFSPWISAEGGGLIVGGGF